MTQLRINAVAVLAVLVCLALGSGLTPAGAQVIPTTTTTTTEPDSTTTTTEPPSPTIVPTTTTPPETTTSSTVPETTTSSETTTTTGPPRSSTTGARETTSTFVPPSGVSSTIAPAAEQVLDADTDRLPFFVALSLLGFTIAIAILTVQWVRSRPRHP